MERVGLQGDTAGFACDLLQRRRPEPIDGDRQQHDANGDIGYVDAGLLRLQQRVNRLTCNDTCRDEQQHRLRQRCDPFHLGMTKMMIVVGRLVAETHREPGDHRSAKIDQGMGRLGQNGEAAGHQPNHQLCERQTTARSYAHKGDMRFPFSVRR